MSGSKGSGSPAIRQRECAHSPVGNVVVLGSNEAVNLAFLGAFTLLLGIDTYYIGPDA